MAVTDTRFAEFSAIKLKIPVEVEGVLMPAGAQGVIMGVYADGLAYEVEFASPHVVLTIEQEDLQTRPSCRTPIMPGLTRVS
nr:hypothetical protein [uncultured Rhodopila sp.]